MGVIKHKFVLLQDGAAAIIVNDKGQILLQSRADNDRWGLPGGCQELGERFEDTVIIEVKEETNLDVSEENLELIAIVSGNSRRNEYPNGDVVINNTALYMC
jgi:phosphohydrolase (mutT/nudix family protein)